LIRWESLETQKLKVDVSLIIKFSQGRPL